MNLQYEFIITIWQTSCFRRGTKSAKKYLTLSHGTLCQKCLSTSLGFPSIYEIREKVNLVQFLLVAPTTLPIQACGQIKYHLYIHNEITTIKHLPVYVSFIFSLKPTTTKANTLVRANVVVLVIYPFHHRVFLLALVFFPFFQSSSCFDIGELAKEHPQQVIEEGLRNFQSDEEIQFTTVMQLERK